MQIIKDKVLKSEQVRWKDFKFIQPEDFKELTKDSYEQLKNSIIDHDFAESFKVWQNNGNLFCLDGFHRCKVLVQLCHENYNVPETFRADFIDCKDRKEAAELVLVYSSIYARTTEDGIYQLIETEGLDWDELKITIDLPNIDLQEFEDGYIKDKVLNFDDVENNANGNKTKHICPKCGFEF